MARAVAARIQTSCLRSVLPSDDAKRLERLLGRSPQAVSLKLESGSVRESGAKECRGGFRVEVRLGRVMRCALSQEENLLDQAEDRILKSFLRQLALESLIGSQVLGFNGPIRGIADALRPVLHRCATGLFMMAVPLAWISSKFGDKEVCYE